MDLTIPQIRTAWLLGVHFGHEWATLFTSAPTSLEEIIKVYHSSSNRRKPTFQWGIERPELNASGEVEHTTTTGRLSWTIRKDGLVRFMVTRKSGALLTVVFDGTRILSAYRHTAGGNVEPRHIEALEGAFAALLVRFVPEIRKGVARTEALRLLKCLTEEEGDALIGHFAGQRASMLCGETATIEVRNSVYEMASGLAIRTSQTKRAKNANPSL